MPTVHLMTANISEAGYVRCGRKVARDRWIPDNWVPAYHLTGRPLVTDDGDKVCSLCLRSFERMRDELAGHQRVGAAMLARTGEDLDTLLAAAQSLGLRDHELTMIYGGVPVVALGVMEKRTHRRWRFVDSPDMQLAVWPGDSDATPGDGEDLDSDVDPANEDPWYTRLEWCESCQTGHVQGQHESIKPDAGFWTVAPFHVSREYGGPEEGGWWYDAGEPMAGPEFPLPVVTKSIEEARAAEVGMQARLDELNKKHGNRPRYSVLSSGEYEARIVDGYPEPFPQERPAYC